MNKIRPPVVAGTYYPGDKPGLSTMIDSFLDISVSPATPLGLIVPHAGYSYSGGVAGYAYKTIQGQKYKTIILIGPSHQVYFHGFALDEHEAWETPLGQAAVNTKLVSEFKKQDNLFTYNSSVFDQEHCLEVQVPFLQKTLNNFTIVPIILGQQTLESCKRLGNILYELTKDKKDVLIIISSDLSHYHTYDQACKLDKNAIVDIEHGDAETFFNNIQTETYEACGAFGITSMLFTAQRYGANIKLLKYANSGDVTGDKTAVVGYASLSLQAKRGNPEEEALSLRVPKGRGNPEEEAPRSCEDILNPEEQQEAINIAHNTIMHYLSTGSKKEYKPKANIFHEKYGAFLTLHKKQALRGCIGVIIGYEPLWQTIQDMAIESATNDPRFAPVTADEMQDIDIEISVLSPLKKVANADEIILGKHGVLVKQGIMQGVFLPQVATETKWNKEEFLGHLCRDKAGLTWDAWKHEDTELYVFSAQIIRE